MPRNVNVGRRLSNVYANNEFRVLEELGEPPACVINHPGFKPVCLNPWTLELLADQYKTLQQARYKNLGSEKRQVMTMHMFLSLSPCL